MIRSEDWNEAMEEIRRLENTKLGIEGGGISGPLSISNPKESDDGSPLRFEKHVDRALISIGKNKALTISAKEGIGIGTLEPKAPLHVIGNLLGAAKDIEDNALRICCGQTQPGKTNWINHSPTALILDVDISSCGFTSAPFCWLNLHGSSNQFVTTGNVMHMILPLMGSEYGSGMITGLQYHPLMPTNGSGTSTGWPLVFNPNAKRLFEVEKQPLFQLCKRFTFSPGPTESSRHQNRHQCPNRR